MNNCCLGQIKVSQLHTMHNKHKLILVLDNLFTKCSANKPSCSDSVLYIEKCLYHHH